MADTSFRVKNGLSVNGSLFVVNSTSGRIGYNTDTPATSLDFSAATDGFKLPTGNTSNRPSTANGTIRYNTQTGLIEGYVNNVWGSIGGTVSVPGANTQLVFNDSGAFGAVADVAFDKVSKTLTVANTVNVGTATINSTNMSVGALSVTSTTVQFGNSTVFSIANSSAHYVGNTQITSGSIQLGSGATINSTFFTGTANLATTATTAVNSINLNGSPASAYLDCGNFTGTLSYVRLGTAGAPQFSTVGVGVAAPGSNALYVYGAFYSYTSVATAGNVLSNSSDRRLKKDVEPIVDALAKVGRLHGITYVFNDTAESIGHKDFAKQVGLFADEVDAVLPEAVKPSPVDTDVNGDSISGENYKTVMYERIIPLLVEAIKELTERVKQLEAR